MNFRFIFFYTFICIINCFLTNAQIPANTGIIFAKEYSKEISLYYAKTFVMKEVLGVSNAVIRFEIDPLAAANSGELTSLVYRCEDKKKEGLIFGFFGNRWTDAGVSYQAYAFKHFPKDKAIELLDKIKNTIDSQKDYLSKDFDNNNVYFQFDDVTFLIYKGSLDKIRVFWNSFDSEWAVFTFERTKRKFEKKIN